MHLGFTPERSCIMRGLRVVPILLLALAASPLAAQQASLTADLAADLDRVQQQLTQLAGAFPADKWDWRPAEGVRSVAEVYMHLLSENYLLAAATGTPAPAETGIKGSDYQTAVAYEKTKLSREAILAELEQSFASLKKSLSALTHDNLGHATALGAQTSNQRIMLFASAHSHEHMGQLIAYARMNNIVPPWSR
jgi:uncharacterized damage-inducible protein DinB